MDLSGGPLNTQFDLQSWSYDVPIEKRRIVSQSYTLIPPAPPAPPVGLSAFTGRKRKCLLNIIRYRSKTI